MNILAAASFLIRYVVDWILFLRGSKRPPSYDEELSKHSVNRLLWFIGLRWITNILVFMDPGTFPSNDADCVVDESNVTALRAEYFEEAIFKADILWRSFGCENFAWLTLALPAGSAIALRYILAYDYCICPSWLVRRLCCCCRAKHGLLHEEVVEARVKRNKLASYAPCFNPEVAMAFKLMDLTAQKNENAGRDSDAESEDSDISSDSADKHKKKKKQGQQLDVDGRLADFGLEYEEEKKAKKKKKKGKGKEDD